MQGRVGLTYDTGGLIAGCRLVDFTAADGYLVGRALAASGTSDIVDVAVVVEALRRAEVVVTSDPQDLRQIADALGAPLTVHVL